jgi:hypothetical protein
MCDGKLDILPMVTELEKMECQEPETKILDEAQCNQKWIGIFVVLFALAGIGVLLALSFWILTWKSAMIVFEIMYHCTKNYWCPTAAPILSEYMD